MKEAECRTIASLIVRVIREGEKCFDEVREEVAALCARFPVYEGEIL